MLIYWLFGIVEPYFSGIDNTSQGGKCPSPNDIALDKTDMKTQTICIDHMLNHLGQM